MLMFVGVQLLRLCLLLRIHLPFLAATSSARLRILLPAPFLLVDLRAILVVLCWVVSSDRGTKSWVVYFSSFSGCCLHGCWFLLVVCIPPFICFLQERRKFNAKGFFICSFALSCSCLGLVSCACAVVSCPFAFPL
jgi:hypothetical protein